MSPEILPQSRSLGKGLFFPTISVSGPEQMATDVMILEKHMKNQDISIGLRFYRWKGFWLSLGKNQTFLPENWNKLVKEKKIQLVRRPSGGNAVLHGGGLTYCLIWISPPRKKREAYYLASQWLINGFSKLGLPLKFGSESPNSLEKNCFATATFADLVDPNGEKRIGSAQLWRKGHLLQHGEILLDPPNKLWMEVFKTKAPEPASKRIPRKGLDDLLQKACCAFWPKLEWGIDNFTQKELKIIAEKSKEYSL